MVMKIDDENKGIEVTHEEAATIIRWLDYMLETNSRALKTLEDSHSPQQLDQLVLRSVIVWLKESKEMIKAGADLNRIVESQGRSTK